MSGVPVPPCPPQTLEGAPSAPSLSDQELEQAIEREYQALIHGESEGEQRAAFNRMAALIRQRSPERVAQMETEQGLR